MTLLSILFGILLPTLNGWLLLGLIQNKTAVLFRGERIALGFLLGTTLTMFVLFCIHIVFGLSLSFWPFFLTQVLWSIVQIGTSYIFNISFFGAHAPLHHETPPTYVRILTALFGAWTGVKISLLALTFIFLTPSYFDDTVDNWNLRAKVFYHEQTLSLLLPGRGDTPADVSSYPPAVPMMKAWMAMTGGWSDAVVNCIHLAWFLCALTLLYFAVRRYASRTWALFSVYAIVAMPLYLMHGTNTYADIFMGAHVFAAIIYLFHAIRSADPDIRSSFLKISAFATALLPFTKNEGLLIFLPPVLLILGIYLVLQHKNAMLSPKEILRVALWYVVPLALIVIPWISYKYANGLTFGNAKGVGELALGWQANVLSAVTVNTFFEGNWLLLFPVLIGLLFWKRKAAFATFLPVSAFFLIVYVGQLFIYLFTSLSVEAILQTGYARGIIQLMPVVIFLTVMLLKDAVRQAHHDIEG